MTVNNSTLYEEKACVRTPTNNKVSIAITRRFCFTSLPYINETVVLLDGSYRTTTQIDRRLCSSCWLRKNQPGSSVRLTPFYVFRFCALVERQRFTNPPEAPPTLQYKTRGLSVWIVMHTFTLLSTAAWFNVSGKYVCPSVLCRCLSYSCIRSALSGVCTHLFHSEVLEDFSGKCLPYASAHRFRRTTAV